MERPATPPAPGWETREVAPRCVVVSVTGEVDASSAPQFEQALLSALRAAGERLVVDLTEVIFFDSAAIRCLVVLRQQAGAHPHRVRLILPGRAGVRRALEVAGLHALLPVAASVSEALDDDGAAAKGASSA